MTTTTKYGLVQNEVTDARVLGIELRARGPLSLVQVIASAPIPRN